MSKWQEIISGRNDAPQPEGSIVVDWYRRENPSESDLLYLLAYALAGKISIDDLKPQQDEAA